LNRAAVGGAAAEMKEALGEQKATIGSRDYPQNLPYFNQASADNHTRAGYQQKCGFLSERVRLIA